jgi:hypothetical protein
MIRNLRGMARTEPPDADKYSAGRGLAQLSRTPPVTVRNSCRGDRSNCNGLQACERWSQPAVSRFSLFGDVAAALREHVRQRLLRTAVIGASGKIERMSGSHRSRQLGPRRPAGRWPPPDQCGCQGRSRAAAGGASPARLEKIGVIFRQRWMLSTVTVLSVRAALARPRRLWHRR